MVSDLRRLGRRRRLRAGQPGAQAAPGRPRPGRLRRRVLVTTARRWALLATRWTRLRAVAHVVLVDDAAGGADRRPAASTRTPTLLAGRRATVAPTSAAVDLDLAAILYTSGSTGRPKGVVLSHRNLLVGAESVSGYLDNTADDVILAALPLSFDAGLSQLTTAFASARTWCWSTTCCRATWSRLCARHGVTGLTCVPPLWIQLAEQEWPAEATAVAALLRQHRRPDARPRRSSGCASIFPQARPFLMYGLTEAFRSTYLDPAEVDRRPDSIGKAIPNAEILVSGPTARRATRGGGRAGPPRAAGRAGLLERPRAHRRAVPAAARRPPTGSAPELAVWSGDTRRRRRGGLPLLRRPRRRDDQDLGLPGQPDRDRGGRLRHRPGPRRGRARRARRRGSASGSCWSCRAAGAPDRGGRRSSRSCASELPLFMVPAEVVVRDELPRSPNGKFDRVAAAQGAGAHDHRPATSQPFARTDGELAASAGCRCRRLAARVGSTPFFAYDRAAVDRRVAEVRAALPPTTSTSATRSRPTRCRPSCSTSPGWSTRSTWRRRARWRSPSTPAARRPASASPARARPTPSCARPSPPACSSSSSRDGEGAGWPRCRRRARRRARGPRSGSTPTSRSRAPGCGWAAARSSSASTPRQVPALMAEMADLGLPLEGFHVFAGSQNLHAEILVEAQQRTVDLVLDLAEAAAEPITLRQPRRRVRHPLLREGRAARPGARRGQPGDARRPSASARSSATCASVIELGRYLVGEAGVYVTRVVDRKVSRGKTYLVVDGGMHHQLAASGNFGQVIRRNYPIAVGHTASTTTPRGGHRGRLPVHAAGPARRQGAAAAGRRRRPGRACSRPAPTASPPAPPPSSATRPGRGAGVTPADSRPNRRGTHGDHAGRPRRA